MHHDTHMNKGKHYRGIAEKIDKNKEYTLDEACALLQEGNTRKFEESVEMHVRLAIDPKKGEQQVRDSLVLPHSVGKTVKIGVITEKNAKDAEGADVIGGEDLIKEIIGGKLPDVDVLIATPDMMPKLAKAAKVLGPRGLMPSPKTDTVTTDVAAAMEELKKGKSTFKNDNGGNIHFVVGKLSLEQDKLVENARTFLDAVKKAKTEAHKGQFIVNVKMCSTMSPSLRVKA